VIATWNKLSS